MYFVQITFVFYVFELCTWYFSVTSLNDVMFNYIKLYMREGRAWSKVSENEIVLTAFDTEQFFYFGGSYLI